MAGDINIWSEMINFQDDVFTHEFGIKVQMT